MSDHWEKIAKGLIKDRIEAEGLIFGFMAAIEVTGVSNPVLDNFVSRSERYFEERKQRDDVGEI